MENLIHRLLLDPLADLGMRQFVGLATNHFYAFTLVFIRMSGLMTIGPIFGQSFVPTNVRVLLVLSMSLLITPTLSDQASIGFQRLDENHDVRLSRDEIPEQLQDRYDRLLERAGKHGDESLRPAEFAPALLVPSSILDWAWTGIGEYAFGMVLGLGVLIILSGVQLAGTLIDHQSGVSLGGVANPALEINGSLIGQSLFMLSVAMLLVMEPTGLHLTMISALIETFQTVPAGEASVSPSTVELLSNLVHQSFVLGVQVAAPLMATMSLIALAMAFLSRTVPQMNVLVVGFPVRAMASTLVLCIALTGIGRQIVDTVPQVIDTLRVSLMGL